jgi:hypothetical protein
MTISGRSLIITGRVPAPMRILQRCRLSGIGYLLLPHHRELSLPDLISLPQGDILTGISTLYQDRNPLMVQILPGISIGAQIGHIHFS